MPHFLIKNNFLQPKNASATRLMYMKQQKKIQKRSTHPSPLTRGGVLRRVTHK